MDWVSTIDSISIASASVNYCGRKRRLRRRRHARHGGGVLLLLVLYGIGDCVSKSNDNKRGHSPKSPRKNLNLNARKDGSLSLFSTAVLAVERRSEPANCGRVDDGQNSQESAAKKDGAPNKTPSHTMTAAAAIWYVVRIH